MKNEQNNENEVNKMETLIKIEKTQNGFAHYVRRADGVVIVEFQGGR